MSESQKNHWKAWVLFTMVIGQIFMAVCFFISGTQADQPRPILILVGAAVFALNAIMNLTFAIRQLRAR